MIDWSTTYTSQEYNEEKYKDSEILNKMDEQLMLYSDAHQHILTEKQLFSQWIKEHCLSIDDIEQELSTTPEKCILTAVLDDKDFPILSNNEFLAADEKFHILKYCWNIARYEAPPITLQLDLFRNELMAGTFNSAVQQTMYQSVLGEAIDIAKSNELSSLLNIGNKKQYPLFVHFLDAFYRDKTKNKEKSNFTPHIWAQQLSFLTKKEQQNVADAISAFARFSIPHIQFNPPTRIHDSLMEICEYLVCVMELIKMEVETKHWIDPVQIDFMVAVNKIIKVDATDEYDTSDCIGNIVKRLNHKKCIHVFKSVTTDQNYYNILLTTYKEFKNKMFQKYNKNQHGMYPNGRRFCLLIDRRGKYELNTSEKLILFEPPHNSIKTNSPNNTIEWQISALLRCLIPSMDSNECITMKSHCNGGLLTFSFLVNTMNQITCYLGCNGKMIRFFPKDVLDILPHLFDSDIRDTFVCNKDVELITERMQILQDLQFELFYRKIYADAKDQWSIKSDDLLNNVSVSVDRKSNDIAVAQSSGNSVAEGKINELTENSKNTFNAVDSNDNNIASNKNKTSYITPYVASSPNPSNINKYDGSDGDVMRDVIKQHIAEKEEKK
eukprot:478008_1